MKASCRERGRHLHPSSFMLHPFSLSAGTGYRTPSSRTNVALTSASATSLIRPHRYLLGDSRREAARLRAQAELWDPVAHALFDRVDVREGGVFSKSGRDRARCTSSCAG